MLQVHVLEQPLADMSWPFVFSYWVVGLVAAGLFVHDVVPMISARSGHWFVLAPTLAFTAWVVASSVWTLSPSRTPMEAVLMAVLVVAALWFGYAVDLTVQVRVLYLVLHLLVVGSFVVAEYRPTWGVDPYGSWQGMFANRNTLGPIATLAILVSFAQASFCRRNRTRVLVLIPIAVDAYVANQAGSVTAWLALAVGLVAAAGVMVVIRARQRGMSRRALTTVGVGAGVGLMVGLPALMYGVGRLGRGSTYSGRRLVWEFIVDESMSRPFHGYGFASFWDHPELIADFDARTGGWWGSGHSTFFDTLLWCGIVGLVLLVAAVVTRFIAVIAASSKVPGRVTVVQSALLSFMIVENVAESMIGYHALFWFLLVATVGDVRFVGGRSSDAVLGDAVLGDAGLGDGELDAIGDRAATRAGDP